MAPNNKPKKPTMLQRQRQLRAQQQQVRRASSNQLPASGGSSGNSRQARAQRANTTRAQAANNQRVINRGIEGFIRRGNAQDKLDKAAQGTRGSGTRTAGAGGGLARRPSSAVTPANRSQGGAAASTRVETVRVRDVTNKPQMTGSKPPARLPGGTGGADTVRGSGVRTGQPGPNRAALPPGRSSGAPTNGSGGVVRAGVRAAGSALGRAGSAVGFLGTAAATLDQARRVFNPKDNLLTSLQQLGRDVSKATGDTTSSGGRPGYRQRGGAANSNNKPTKPVADYRDAQGNLYDGNTGRLKQAAPRRSTPPTRSSGGNPPAPGSSRRQPSSGGGSSAPSRPSAPSPQRASAPKPAEQSAPAKPKASGPNIGPQASGDNYGESLKIGQQLSGNNDQPDMERRRAFLDAKDSLSGAKAVRDLQEKRKKRLAELNK